MFIYRKVVQTARPEKPSCPFLMVKALGLLTGTGRTEPVDMAAGRGGEELMYLLIRTSLWDYSLH